MLTLAQRDKGISETCKNVERVRGVKKKIIQTEVMMKRGQEETPLFSVRLGRSPDALIILNKINVSRNSNKNALLTKAD